MRGFLITVLTLLTFPAWGQFMDSGAPIIRGVPPSVTSFGFGGQPGFHGVPPSVTSLNFTGAPVVSFDGQHFPFRHQPGFAHNRRFASPFFTYYVPYAYPVYVEEPEVYEGESDYAPGPTIFDRREPGMREAPRPRSRARDEEEDYRKEAPQRAERESEPQPVQEQPRTLLVFKDGHIVEISNYAIVGNTLYDLQDGRTQKFALMELDLAATVKQNDQRGISFQLPAAARTN